MPTKRKNKFIWHDSSDDDDDSSSDEDMPPTPKTTPKKKPKINDDDPNAKYKKNMLENSSGVIPYKEWVKTHPNQRKYIDYINANDRFLAPTQTTEEKVRAAVEDFLMEFYPSQLEEIPIQYAVKYVEKHVKNLPFGFEVKKIVEEEFKREKKEYYKTIRGIGNSKSQKRKKMQVKAILEMKYPSGRLKMLTSTKYKDNEVENDRYNMYNRWTMDEIDEELKRYGLQDLINWNRYVFVKEEEQKKEPVEIILRRMELKMHLKLKF